MSKINVISVIEINEFDLAMIKTTMSTPLCDWDDRTREWAGGEEQGGRDPEGCVWDKSVDVRGVYSVEFNVNASDDGEAWAEVVLFMAEEKDHYSEVESTVIDEVDTGTLCIFNVNGDIIEVNLAMEEKAEIDILAPGTLRSIQALSTNSRAASAYAILSKLSKEKRAIMSATGWSQPDVALATLIGMVKELEPIFSALEFLMTFPPHMDKTESLVTVPLLAAHKEAIKLKEIRSREEVSQDQIDRLMAFGYDVNDMDWMNKLLVVGYAGLYHDTFGDEDLGDLAIAIMSAEADVIRDVLDEEDATRHNMDGEDDQRPHLDLRPPIFISADDRPEDDIYEDQDE